MHILLTNDDGIFAPGLFALYKELAKLGEVTVVAPAEIKSGASHSISFWNPLVCTRVNINGLFDGFSVHGSPADCVKLACMRLCDKPIDLLVSGMNDGANAGINVYYSGTVAAAMEGAFLKVPSVAMSMVCEENMDFDRGAKYCVEVLKKLLPVKKGDVININIPALSKGEPKGIKVVPQSTEGFDERYDSHKNEKGQAIFKLAGGRHKHEEIETDTIALADGYITVTALILGMTNHKKTEELKKNFKSDEKIEIRS